jgi:hypothetical protein
MLCVCPSFSFSPDLAAILRRSVRKSSIAAGPSTQSNDQDLSDIESPVEILDSNSLIPPNTGFADVASQVVTSKRAAKGFIAVWAKENRGATCIHKGIHMEKKKLDLRTVASEYKEIKRRQFYQELLVYLIFLLFFFHLLEWLPVQDSYQQNDVVGYSTCREEGVCELKQMENGYEFATTLHDKICQHGHAKEENHSQEEPDQPQTTFQDDTQQQQWVKIHQFSPSFTPSK